MNKALLSLVVFAGVCFSCGFDLDSETISFADNLIESETSLAMVDTFTVKMSTVKTDSVPTSGDTVLLVGNTVDVDFGKVSASAYFEIGLPAYTNVLEEDRYDSLCLVLRYSSDHYGDTTQLNTFRIHRLTEKLVSDESGYLWNTSSVEYSPLPMGSLTFQPRPSSGKRVNIRLSDVLGRQIFKMMKNKADTVTDASRFIDFFNGIALVPDNSNKAILSFSADTMASLVLYSHRVELEAQNITHVFPFSDEGDHFNRIVTDRQGTLLENLTLQREEIPAEQSGNKAFVQSGTGLFTRVDFPSMQRIMESDKKYLLLKAELIMIPEPGSYNTVKLPPQLVLYHTDKTNRIVSEISGNNSSVLPAELRVDKMFHENTYYRFDITSFLTTEIADAHFDTDHGLLIGETSSKLGKSLNQAIFSARKSSVYKPVVKLYFMYYKI